MLSPFFPSDSVASFFSANVCILSLLPAMSSAGLVFTISVMKVLPAHASEATILNYNLSTHSSLSLLFVGSGKMTLQTGAWTQPPCSYKMPRRDFAASGPYIHVNASHLLSFRHFPRLQKVVLLFHYCFDIRSLLLRIDLTVGGISVLAKYLYQIWFCALMFLFNIQCFEVGFLI